MALARIKKIEMIGLREKQKQILTLLQKMETIELIPPKTEAVHRGVFSETLESDQYLLEEAISCLAPYAEKIGFIEGLAGLRPMVFFDQIEQTLHTFDWKPIANELIQLRQSRINLTQMQAKLEQQKQHLLPWETLPFPLEALHSTQYCDIMIGTLNTRDYVPLLETTAASGISLHVNVIKQEKTYSRVVLLYLKKDFEPLEAIVKSLHFDFTQFSHLNGTVKENLHLIDKKIESALKEIAEVEKRLILLAGNEFKLKMLFDYLGSIQGIHMSDRYLCKQEYTFTLMGWTKANDLKELQDKIASIGSEIAIFITNPDPDEEVPVILENRGVFKPFEFITQIYGMPKYGEIDPTPFLAPFFFLYFGFCVSDAGYGLILMAISWWVMKKFKIGPTGTNFWRMLMLCGISTIFIGALTGSWFGNLFDLMGGNFPALRSLVIWKNKMIILDPMKEPTKLLGIALSFGIIHVWFGSIVAIIGNIKNRRFLDIFLDQFPILTFLFGLTGLGLNFLQIIGNGNLFIFKTAALTGAIGLILTQGRSEKEIGSKFFYGFYNLYSSLSGYLSDILSYSRLWALGLVTSVMAVTINLLAVQFSQIFSTIFPFLEKIPFLRTLISTLIILTVFIFGHLLSVSINLLGAFVHPLRLQFVEFFPKFFKPGGQRFKPFKNDFKYVHIKYERS